MSSTEWLLDEPSPSEVANASFQMVRRGYDPVEVQAFARAVSAELQRLDQENRELRSRLAQSEQRAHTTLDESTIADYLGEETTRLLHAARDTAAGVVGRAESKAAEMVERANDEAARIRAEAMTEATAELRRAQDDARRMVYEATAGRRNTLAELARRRDLACEQLDGLLSGRDVLVQALANVASTAGELINRLDAISAEPADFVNLDPSVESADAVDPSAVLRVTAGRNGTRGERAVVDGPRPNRDDTDAPVMLLDDNTAVGGA